MLPYLASETGYALLGAFYLGITFWTHTWVTSAILDRDLIRRPYLRAFAEAYILGCMCVCVALGTGVAHGLLISAAVSLQYAVFKLRYARLNPWTFLIHLLTLPVTLGLLIVPMTLLSIALAGWG